MKLASVTEMNVVWSQLIETNLRTLCLLGLGDGSIASGYSCLGDEDRLDVIEVDRYGHEERLFHLVVERSDIRES